MIATLDKANWMTLQKIIRHLIIPRTFYMLLYIRSNIIYIFNNKNKTCAEGQHKSLTIILQLKLCCNSAFNQQDNNNFASYIYVEFNIKPNPSLLLDLIWIKCHSEYWLMWVWILNNNCHSLTTVTNFISAWTTLYTSAQKSRF